MNKLNPIPIILASGSPRRRELLRQIDLEFKVVVSHVHEDFDLDLPAVEFAKHYAYAKAQEVAKDYPNSLVIGADTIVVLDNNILGKPRDREDSFSMLTRLSGRTHTVLTGMSLQWKRGHVSDTFHAATQVTFNTLSNDDISYYIDTHKPFDKAGSYGIQDWFSVCVNKINGCFYNVMGFPLSAFYKRYKSISQAYKG